MKNIQDYLLATFLFIFSFNIISCGPSESEIAKQQAKLAKTIADSLEKVYQEREQTLEEEKVRAQASADSLTRAIDDLYENQESKSTEAIDLKKDLIAVERENPLDYLSINFKTDFNLISGKDVIKGTILNSATLARFKDIKFEINCYSGTNTLIKTLNLTIYEHIAPKGKLEFVHKFKSPKGTKTVALQVTAATPS